MILLVCLILFIWAVSGLCADYDHEDERRYDYELAERRHKERLQAIERARKSNNRHKTTHRRVVKKGDVTLGEEITEEYFE